MESLAPEVTPFGIRSMLVEPGYFRTEHARAGVDQVRRILDRGTRRTNGANCHRLEAINGRQGGDPAKLSNDAAAPTEEGSSDAHWTSSARSAQIAPNGRHSRCAPARTAIMRTVTNG